MNLKCTAFLIAGLGLMLLVTVCDNKAPPASKAVTLKPQELVMVLDQFPLPGFKVTGDVSQDQGKVWRRTFTATDSVAAGYSWVSADVRILDSSNATSWIKVQDCTWRGSGTAPSGNFELAPPAFGGEAKACRYEFGGGSRVFTYVAADRNVGLFVQASSRNTDTDDAMALKFLALVAERQAAIIDRLSPPYPSPSEAGAASLLHFSPPETLPAATAGQPYEFTFCQPAPPASNSSPCGGPGSAAIDPTGGSPPYFFEYGTSGDFPPFGIILSRDGHLGGIPYPETSGRTYRFSVCVFDAKTASSCRDVSLTVEVGATQTTVAGTTPSPPNRPTPKPTQAPTPRPVTVQLQNLALTVDQLSLPGLKMADEAPSAAGQWRRRFTPADPGSFGYSWMLIDLVPLRGPTATSWIKGMDCVWRSTEGLVPVGSSELTPPAVGDGAKACRYDFASGGRLFSYETGSRNVGILLQAWTNSSSTDVTDAATLDLLRSISERQLAIVDRLDPPGPGFVQSSDPSGFPLSLPTVLPKAVAGEAYKFSLCQSATGSVASPCGPTPPAADDASAIPYRFQYGLSGGFPPLGIALSKDGQLGGTPHWATAGRDYPFTVCSVDQKGVGVCSEVSLTVGVPPPVPVTGKPEGLALSLDNLPVTDFKVVNDEQVTDAVWQRVFVANDPAKAEYSAIILQLLAKGDMASADFLKVVDCEAIGAGISATFGSKTSGVSREVAAPSVGDGAKGCRTDLSSGPKVYIVATSTRNAGVIVIALPARPNATDTDVAGFLSALADRQLARIDRLSPPGPSLTLASGATKFQFNPAATLPNATAGKSYKFSFCQPEPASRTSSCGPMPPTTTPIGGYPPYHFQYGVAGGFPPFGITLGKDGHLDGTPQWTTAGSTYRFTVCAIDLKGDFVCREVSLAVEAPTPLPVTKKPQELVIPLNQFPLPGFKISEDVAVAGGWSREFRPDDTAAADYYQVTIHVVPLKDPTASGWINAQNCQDGGSTASKNSNLPSPPLGDGAKACKQDFGNAGKSYTLATGARNVGIFLDLTPSKQNMTDDEAVSFLALLAERQLATIDNVSPPGHPLVRSSGAVPFQFTPPATLPNATAGKPYKFLFCQPEPKTRTSPCGPMPATTDPTGGSPPYHFQYGTMGGFPPFGLTLGKDGHLDGTPQPATAGKTYRFTVCAIDLKGDFVCREVSLRVEAGIASVKLDPLSATIQQGNNQLFHAIARDSNGAVLVDLPASAFTWSSANPAIAAVDKSGFVDGRSPGTTEITASINGIQAKATVTVPPPVQLYLSGKLQCVTDSKTISGIPADLLNNATASPTVANFNVNTTHSETIYQPCSASGTITVQKPGATHWIITLDATLNIRPMGSDYRSGVLIQTGLNFSAPIRVTCSASGQPSDGHTDAIVVAKWGNQGCGNDPRTGLPTSYSGVMPANTYFQAYLRGLTDQAGNVPIHAVLDLQLDP